MKKLCYLFIICILAGSVLAYEIVVPASMSCRTEMLQPDTNRHDSSKLSIRSDSSAAKSWIKFDTSAVDPNVVREAILRLTLHEDEGDFTFDVSAVNDNVTDNILWVDHSNNEDPVNDIYALTWNNAPGNAVSDTLNPDFTKATLMGTVDLTGNYAAGSQHFLDVTSAIQGNTDAVVQFVLHNGTSLINCATHDHPTGVEYFPTLFVTMPPLGADWPNPADEGVVPTSFSELSWTNPDPNDGSSDITCTVYLAVDDGSEPNKLAMASVELDANENSVSVSELATLTNDTPYIWIVDCLDPSRTPSFIEGEKWSFYVGEYPSVDAGQDLVFWLTDYPSGVDVTLSGTTSDDGTYTQEWTQTGGDANVTISSADQDEASVTLTVAGDYEFTLTANDGVLVSKDSVRIVVGDDACDASHILTGDDYNEADQNEDCIVDLTDLAELILNDWLSCTDDQTDCGI